VTLKVGCERDELLMDVFDTHHSRVRNDGAHAISLPAHGWRWLRVGGPDSTLYRSMLNLSNDTVL
jgi:hypothetical protein